MMVPYQISYDEEYVSKVNPRAFQQNQEGKITDFKDATVAEKDAEGDYVRKEWKLKHKELYYFEGLLFGLFIGLVLQIFNMVWSDIYRDKFDEDKDRY